MRPATNRAVFSFLGREQQGAMPNRVYWARCAWEARNMDNSDNTEVLQQSVDAESVPVWAYVGNRNSPTKHTEAHPQRVLVTFADVIRNARTPSQTPCLSSLADADTLRAMDDAVESRLNATSCRVMYLQCGDDEGVADAEKTLDELKATAPTLCFQNAVRYGTESPSALLKVDLDEKDHTADELGAAIQRLKACPHIMWETDSARGRGRHGYFLVQAGEAHFDAARAYILRMWPHADANAISPRHTFKVYPGGEPRPAIPFHASPAEIAEHEQRRVRRNETATPTDGRKANYLRTYYDALPGECVALSHDDMVKKATRCGNVLRECDALNLANECADIILDGCRGEGHRTPETFRTVRGQIQWGIEHGEWKPDWKTAPDNRRTATASEGKRACTAQDATATTAPNDTAQDDADARRAALWHVRHPKKDELGDEIRRFIADFYAVFLRYDGGLCEIANGYLYTGADFEKIMKRTVMQCEPEGKGRPQSYTVAQILQMDTNDRRRVELREIRSYKSLAAVTVEHPALQCGECAPMATVNHLPRLAPHDGAYGEAEKAALHAALMQFARCFDTPKEFVWALNCVCHKAVFGVARRCKCILFLFDDGIEGEGAGRGKTLFSRLARFVYGREHVSTTRKKYGFRAEKDFDGLENQGLFNVCDEFRPLNQKGYMDEICAYVDGDRFDYTEKGKQTLSIETVCQLILTANTASEMELTNRTRRRVAFLRFDKPWDGDTEGARVVYRMCGERGDQWANDDDPDAVRLRSCLWRFCAVALADGGRLHAPVMLDVDKALGHTEGQDLARAQKAAADDLYQRIVDYLADAADREQAAMDSPVFGETRGGYAVPLRLETTARAIANTLHCSSQAVSKAIRDNGEGEIVAEKVGRNLQYRLAPVQVPMQAKREQPTEAPTKWDYPKTFDEIEQAIVETLAAI